MMITEYSIQLSQASEGSTFQVELPGVENAGCSHAIVDIEVLRVSFSPPMFGG
jgi:hypothetical protein